MLVEEGGHVGAGERETAFGGDDARSRRADPALRDGQVGEAAVLGLGDGEPALPAAQGPPGAVPGVVLAGAVVTPGAHQQERAVAQAGGGQGGADGAVEVDPGLDPLVGRHGGGGGLAAE
ncbi:hypothetical protein [Nonomuraea sp. NPDC049646]|uniref:hypothetical protein n=1 Tax=unclassified Nonomuraea TaxID=2593643 RepID=UPI0037AB4272